jgi:predicted  nucleic acid-binding Zn-ribbon protein
MENIIAKKLESLLKLQSIDSKLDEINKIRGDLPVEVQDLEDDIIGFETRISKFTDECKRLTDEISLHRNAVIDAEALLRKYEDQQANVKNDREYAAITKEIELQGLNIQLAQRKSKEAALKLEKKQEQIDTTQAELAELKISLEAKQKELAAIIAESIEDEEKLLKEREKKVKTIEDRLYNSYSRIRQNAKNGLAVVTVKRDACGGCFNVVPPQRQADIRLKRKIIVCEHCGRILADVEDIVVAPTPEKTKRTVTKKKVETAAATDENTF